jgi:murein DD-endopeptidase MepM/ murein hydrolase activator NlpD
MSVVVALRSWPLPRVVALAVIAAGAAACSSESTRFTNPFSSQQPQSEATGSIQQQQQQQQRAPAGRVQTSALPPPGAGQPGSAPPGGGVSGGGRGMASYTPGPTSDPVVTGSVQSSPSQPSQPSNNPPPSPSRQAPSRPSASQPAAQPGVHVVAPGETLYRIARQYNMPLTDLARLNNIEPHTKLNIGQRLSLPASRTSHTARPEAQKVTQSKALNAPKANTVAKTEPKAQPKPKTISASPPTETASVATPASEPPPAANPVRSGNSSMAFRWPAKGRIIAGFGPKTNGQTNDGINIAVPEGTPVKAAADGTVAYAGNELKGYGNLVLVRHADGYVTAYAHAKELLVRRGDSVRRGQDIARSGQTGNVDTPQLHFEIRKGPAPIDPMPLLGGG